MARESEKSQSSIRVVSLGYYLANDADSRTRESECLMTYRNSFLENPRRPLTDVTLTPGHPVVLETGLIELLTMQRGLSMRISKGPIGHALLSAVISRGFGQPGLQWSGINYPRSCLISSNLGHDRSKNADCFFRRVNFEASRKGSN